VNSGQWTMESGQWTVKKRNCSRISFLNCLLSTVCCFLFLMTFISCHVGDHTPPGTPHDLQYVCDAATGASSCPVSNTRALTWIASGDDGDSGQALQYDLRWSTQLVTEAVYQDANQFINEPGPQISGADEVILLPRMYPGASLSFGLKSLDEVAQYSGLVATPLVEQDFIRAQLGDAGATQAGLGTRIMPIGDLDYRGLEDIAVSAPGAVNPDTLDATGAVFIYLNADQDYLLTTQNNIPRAASSVSPAAVIYGQTAGGQFGAAISADSDFNGDGLADLVVGEPGAGKVYIFLGGGAGRANFGSIDINPATPAQFTTDEADITIISPAPGFGSSVALLGDMNGQAGCELLVGSPLEGRAYLFYGGLIAGNGISGAAPIVVDLGGGGFADWTIIGPTGSDFGEEVARVQGLVADGAENFAVGAPEMALVYVFQGGVGGGQAIDFSLSGPQIQDISNGGAFDLLIKGEGGSHFGAVIEGRRSLNASLYASLAISASSVGKVFVFYSGDQGVIPFPLALNTVHDAILNGADQTITGDPSIGFGASISAMADLNGDGWVDLLVGAPHALDTDNADVGAVYEFLNGLSVDANRTAADADYVTYGTATLGQFGASVAGINMLVSPTPITNLLNYDDFLVGAPGENAAYAEF